MKIGNKLKLIREEKNMTLQELSDFVGVSKQSIHRYEQDMKSPGAITLQNISKALDVHPTYFFNNEYTPISINNLKFREEEKLENSEYLKNEIKSVCKDYLYRLIELKSLVENEVNFDNPIAGIEINTTEDVEKAAKKIRSKWKLGNVPIRDITELIETKGLPVIEIEMSENFNGLSGKANNEIPFIVINKNCKDLTRKRFTLLHELGHVVLEFSEILEESTIEKLCNHFAGAVLLVDDTVALELGKNRTKISLEELNHIKEKYGISIQSIIIRAKVTGFISNETSNKWWELYNDWNNARMEPSDFAKYNGDENPSMFNSLIIKGIKESRLTWSKAAELKKTKVDILKSELKEIEFDRY